MEFGTKLTAADCELLDEVTAAPQHYNARTDIIAEGDKPHDAHVVLEGFACRYKTLVDGRRQIMAIFVPGDLCDFHVQILGHMDRSIGTIGPASIAAVPPDRIQQLTDNPRINCGLWWMTLVDEGTLREWLANVGQRSADMRLAHLMCELRLRLVSVGHGEQDRFVMPSTQNDLADAMGLSSVHVNRTMQDLRQQNLICAEGQSVIFPNVRAMEEFADIDPDYLHLGDQARHAAVEARERL